MKTVRLLALDTLQLQRDGLGRLHALDASDGQPLEVTPIRLFPRSDPDRWIALLDADGHEVVCIEDPGRLAANFRELLRETLAEREFVPVITRIVWVSGNSEPCEWHVETDRGPTKFILKSEEDLLRIGEHGVLIIDAHGIRYLVSDRRALDSYSQRIIEWYV